MTSNRASRRRRTTRRLGKRRPITVPADEAARSERAQGVAEPGAEAGEEARQARPQRPDSADLDVDMDPEDEEEEHSTFEALDGEEGDDEEGDDAALDSRATLRIERDPEDEAELDEEARGDTRASSGDDGVDETSRTLPHMPAVTDGAEADRDVDGKAEGQGDDEQEPTHPRIEPGKIAREAPDGRSEQEAPEVAQASAPPQERVRDEPQAPRDVVVLAPARIISDPPPAPAATGDNAVDAALAAGAVEAMEAAIAVTSQTETATEPQPVKPPEQPQRERKPRGRLDSAEFEELDVEAEAEPADEEDLRTTRTPPPPPPDARAKAKRPPPPPPRSSSASEGRDQQRRTRQWWERFFSDDYLMSVLPPTKAQIKRQVDFLEQSLRLSKGSTVLDVGCGLGLHSLELARRGCLVVGLDLSLTMITRAAEEAQHNNLKINFLHADIREIEFDGTFDAVICLGTTFGFFDDEANRDVLLRLHQALKPGGRILLDVVNRDYVIRAQPNLVWFEGDECVCMEESDFNYFSSRLVVKRTMMAEDGRQSDAEYSIRLYSLHELGQLMQQMGFRVIEVSGQEATRGMFFGAHSQRILMLGERRAKNRKSTALPPEPISSEVPKPPPKKG